MLKLFLQDMLRSNEIRIHQVVIIFCAIECALDITYESVLLCKKQQSMVLWHGNNGELPNLCRTCCPMCSIYHLLLDRCKNKIREG